MGSLEAGSVGPRAHPVWFLWDHGKSDWAWPGSVGGPEAPQVSAFNWLGSFSNTLYRYNSVFLHDKQRNMLHEFDVSSYSKKSIKRYLNFILDIKWEKVGAIFMLGIWYATIWQWTCLIFLRDGKVHLA